MTGSLRAFREAPPRTSHDHFDIVLDSGVTLRYRDPRRFGALLWLRAARRRASAPRLARPRAVRSGLRCALSVDGDAPPHGGHQARADGQRPHRRRGQHLRERIAVSRRHPADDARANRCRRRARPVARRGPRRRSTEAIAKGGSTLRDYVDSRGEPGYFQLDYFVYGREGLPCRVCGTAIKSIRQGGRATSYCPRCQR